MGMTTEKLCDWCGEPMVGYRADAITCSTPCRQARARFRVAPAGATAGRRIRVGYADPPYPGCAKKYYDDQEVDHAELVDRLKRNYPDGWALSTSSEALKPVLALCPDETRVCIWVKGARSSKSLRPHRAWEALLVVGGRPYHDGGAPYDLQDVLEWGGRQHSHPDALVGMKPAAYCEWMFRQLGLEPGDALDDLYPGSGAVQRAWKLYTSTHPGGTLPSRLSESLRSSRSDG